MASPESQKVDPSLPLGMTTGLRASARNDSLARAVRAVWLASFAPFGLASFALALFGPAPFGLAPFGRAPVGLAPSGFASFRRSAASASRSSSALRLLPCGRDRSARGADLQ